MLAAFDEDDLSLAWWLSCFFMTICVCCYVCYLNSIFLSPGRGSDFPRSIGWAAIGRNSCLLQHQL